VGLTVVYSWASPLFKPLFIPKTAIFLAQNGTFFNQKRLTVGMLKTKLPLIIIIAP